MCDYSLEHVTARPARVADELVVTSFQNTISRGFVARGDLNTAVCLRPGTELRFESAPVYEHSVTYLQTAAPGDVARFRQIDGHLARAHHDALEFADGTVVPLTRLLPGQRAVVLQLPAEPRPEERDRQPAAAVRALESAGAA